MKQLNFDEIRALTHGAVEITEETDGLHFHKCSEKQRLAWKQKSNTLYERSMATSGVRLEFETDAEKIVFEASSGTFFEIWIDGMFRTQIRVNEFCERNEKPFVNLEKGIKRVLFAFPCHEIGVLSSFALDGETFVRPVSYEKKILFLGDSITQGWDASINSLCYAYRTAIAMNADFLLNGIGGSYYNEASFDRVPYEPDTVIVAYGSNDFSRSSVSDDENAAHINAYLDLVKEAYGDRRVIVITPIWRSDKSDEWHRTVRSIIARAATARGFETVDGGRLFPQNTVFFADGFLHPNDLGFSIYAERLVQYLKTGSL